MGAEKDRSAAEIKPLMKH